MHHASASARIVLAVALCTALAGCGSGGAPAASQTSVAATVAAAVVATNDAATQVAASVATAAAATSAAVPTATLPPTATNTPLPPTAAPTDTPIPPTAAPTDTPVPVEVAAPTDTPVPPAPTAAPDTVTMTEEELSALIDQAVAEAVSATEAVTSTTDEAAADGSISQEELDQIEELLTVATETLATTNTYVADYYSLYADLATETVALLQEVEADLSAMSTSLDQIATILEGGAEAATAARQQLQQASDAAKAGIVAAQATRDQWLAGAQGELEALAQQMLSVPPQNVAVDRQAAIAATAAYVESVRAGLADGALSRPELDAVAQAGADACAGLKAQGGAALEALVEPINGLTANLARGSYAQAEQSLSQIEAVLGRR